MRLVTYARNGRRRLGALTPDEVVVDLPDAVGHPAFPTTMEALVQAGPGGLEVAREALGRSGALEHAVPAPRLLAPVHPGSLRRFQGFEDHVARSFARRGEPVPEPWYEAPVYHKGNHRSVVGPDQEIPWPSFAGRLDYGVEVACVLGGRGRDLDEEGARRLIFGYTLMNDWTAPDLLGREMACGAGPAKASDFATSLGPCIVPADEIGPAGLTLEARIDGETWSKGELAESRWTFPQLIAYVSQGEDVWPGDVYGSGTFEGGCATDLGRALRPGSTVELEAPSIGVLRNPVGAA